MTLDEAIRHEEEIASITANPEYHRQLADWLKELKQYREQDKKQRSKCPMINPW